MSSPKEDLLDAFLPVALNVLKEFSEHDFSDAAIRDQLIFLLFEGKKLDGVYRSGIITSDEFLNAIAANLVSFALRHEPPPHPTHQILSEGSMQALREVLFV